MFGLFKSISLVIVGILITGCTFISNISNNDTMSNDDLVNSYDNFLQDISVLRSLSIIAVVFFHVYGMMFANHFPATKELYHSIYFTFNNIFKL